MLARSHRVTESGEFGRIVRGGRAAGRRRMVVHALLPDAADPVRPVRAGFVVGRGVGSAVVRHRVTRRLRHLVRDRLECLPPGVALVVRAQPAAASACAADLADDLDAALGRLGMGCATRDQGWKR